MPSEPVIATASPTEVLSIDWIDWPWADILDASLDRPTVSVSSGELALDIAGWIVGRGNPVQAIRVLAEPFPPHGLLVGEAPVAFVRQGVQDRFDGMPPDQPSGFETTIGVAALPLEFEIVLEAIFGDGRTVRFARIRGRHGRVDAGIEPALAPILLTSLGRTGTTWLMRLLTEHPRIAVHNLYPYEARAAAYWLHAFDVLAEPHHHRRADQDGFHNDRGAVRHHPLYQIALRDPVAVDWLRGPYVRQLARFAIEATDGFYSAVATANERADPVYFAEKFHVGQGRWLARTLYPTLRELVLVRDPRDIFCSILAFNAKRGQVDFGRAAVASDAEFVERLRVDFVRLVGVVDADPDSTHLVRYEDLILQPLPTLTRLFGYLGLDSDAGAIDELIARASGDTPEMAAHRTSGGARESIGRWRRDLPPDLAELCNTAFGPTLQRLGYDPA